LRTKLSAALEKIAGVRRELGSFLYAKTALEMRAGAWDRASIFRSSPLTELRALLYTSGIERGAFYRGVTERNFRADGAADVYVSRHHMVGLQEAKPIQAGH